MNLSISNLAWSAEYDQNMYECLENLGFKGLEIAPTRIFAQAPYDKLCEAKSFAESLKSRHGLVISSMQSIWFGRDENIFSSLEERQFLISYTKKAIDFASAAGCGNLVFGCPKNRNIHSNDQYGMAVDFFAALGEYAKDKNAVVAIEPNPAIYDTNFINTTEQAFRFAREVNSTGVMVTVDFGTILQNKENIDIVYKNIALVNHIHISEPFLEIIQKREAHKRLAKLLKLAGYHNFVSIEMRNTKDMTIVADTLHYIKEVFS